MITKAIIENFQSHKKTELEFVPGVNVIIGESDSGKSAALRAIYWVASNRPLGDGFRSEWGGETRVAVHTSEGNVVERIKAAGRNEYIINGSTIRAFGSEVPEQVLEALKLDEASIQSQMDLPFLLATSPGETAKLLNKAASIDDIDLAISNLKSAYTKLGNSIKFNEGELQEDEEELKQYDDILEIEGKLQQLEGLEGQKREKQESLSKLKVLITNIENIEAELQKTKHVPALLKKYATLQNKHRSLEKKRQTLSQLDRLVGGYEKAQTALRSIQTRQEGLEKEFREICPEECPLCGSPM